MVTGKQLIELDIFHNVKLKAGRKGLDREITWVYAKHTKTITPWVHGGELLLVSGYESGITETDLESLVEESIANNLSGVLIEGGINFKKMPPSVIAKADAGNLPLFFVEGVISFLDITRDVMDIIMENRYISQRSISVFDQLLSAAPLNEKTVAQIFHGTGISVKSHFIVGVFTMKYSDETVTRADFEPYNQATNFSRKIRKHVSGILEKYGTIEICKINLDSVDYLLYAEDLDELHQICEDFGLVNDIINVGQNEYNVFLSFSEHMPECKDILDFLDQAYFTATLLEQNVFPDKIKGFSDLGSYQMIYYTEDKNKLIGLRDRYLKKMYLLDKETSSNLLITLKEYLNQDGNILQTSKKLYIHRNTLQYRLEKIETLTGSKLEGLEAKRDFLNAFMIMDVIPFE